LYQIILKLVENREIVLENLELHKMIIRNRVLRTQSRKPESSYKVDCRKVLLGDSLELRIYDENNQIEPLETFTFSGDKLHDRNSIHFSAKKVNNIWQIKFYNIKPD